MAESTALSAEGVYPVRGGGHNPPRERMPLLLLLPPPISRVSQRCLATVIYS